MKGVGPASSVKLWKKLRGREDTDDCERGCREWDGTLCPFCACCVRLRVLHDERVCAAFSRSVKSGGAHPSERILGSASVQLRGVQTMCLTWISVVVHVRETGVAKIQFESWRGGRMQIHQNMGVEASHLDDASCFRPRCWRRNHPRMHAALEGVEIGPASSKSLSG